MRLSYRETFLNLTFKMMLDFILVKPSVQLFLFRVSWIAEQLPCF